jgi:hypothetical protein
MNSKSQTSKLEKFVKTSHGAFHLEVVGPQNIFDQKPIVIMTISDWLKLAASKPPGKGHLCLTCEAEFVNNVLPLGFVVATPFIPTKNTNQIVISGVCEACFCTKGLKEKILAVWRKMLPDIREAEGGVS